MHLDDFNNIESLGIFILFFFFPSFLVLKRAHEFSKHQPVSDSTVCDSIILLQLFPVSLAFQAFFIFCWPNLIWKLSKCAIDIFWNQHHSCLFIEQAITSSKVDKQKQKEVRQRCRERDDRRPAKAIIPKCELFCWKSFWKLCDLRCTETIFYFTEPGSFIKCTRAQCSLVRFFVSLVGFIIV